jgi:hypothetical protein
MGEDPKGQVWTYDKQTGRIWSSIPEETAVQTHFYSVEQPDGTMNTSLEQALSNVEGAAAPVYQRLLQRIIPDASQERMDFAYFIALMIVRTPAMRRMTAETYGQMLQVMNYAYATNPQAFETLIRDVEKESGKKLDSAAKDAIKQAMIDPSGYALVLPQEITLKVLKSAENLARLLFDMYWFTMRADQGFLITSDNPVVREVDPRSRHPFFGDYGFLNKTAEVTFPLSRDILLLMSWSDARRKETLDREALDRANEARAAHSDRYLYTHICHKYVKRLSAQFKDFRPGMTAEGFGPDKFAPIKVSRRSKK